MTIAACWVENPFKQSASLSPWRKQHEDGFRVPQNPKGKLPVKASIPIGVRRVCGIEIPNPISNIADAVEKSEYILKLPDDWDEEGSPHYERATWERAVKFVIHNASALWRKEGVITEAPAIHNGPDGSIDIHWKIGAKELLLNVPATSGRPSAFFGKDKASGFETKGNLDTSATNEWLLMWITEK